MTVVIETTKAPPYEKPPEKPRSLGEIRERHEKLEQTLRWEQEQRFTKDYLAPSSHLDRAALLSIIDEMQAKINELQEYKDYAESVSQDE